MHLPGGFSLHGFLFITGGILLHISRRSDSAAAIPLQQFRGICMDGIPRNNLPGEISLHGFHFYHWMYFASRFPQE
jgi:hypothetical protein